MLEPAQIVDFNLQTRRVVLRQLRRKISADPHARPNELVFTNNLLSKAPSRIIRKCSIREFGAEAIETGNRLPTPYDRDGAGDFFFVLTSSKVDNPLPNGRIHCGDDPTITLPPLEPGWDPTAPARVEKLKGMGIFCGGGSFDRGLEEGGAVDFHYAIDWAERAIHSYRANAHDSSKLQYNFG